ncbi:MAG: cytochrome c oxidase assembly protein [Actinomycetota bacterium]
MEAPFSWAWHPHPDAWLLVGILVIGYRIALRRRERTSTDPFEVVSTRRQRGLFYGGCLALLISGEWPIHDLAEGYLYSVHMIQHLMLTLLVAPLLLAGLPAWLFRKLLPGPLMRVARTLSRPLIALIVANSVLVLTHWPLLVNRSISDEFLHLGLHVVVVVAAWIMWMPVLSPVLEIPKLAKPTQAGYLFLQSLVPTVPASFLTFGAAPLYKAYEMFPHPFGVSTLDDQRTAGLIMKLVGGSVLWIVITVIFFAWFSMESRHGVDALAHAGTDRDLDRMELRS